MSTLRIFEKKIVLCKKGDEITGLDGIALFIALRIALINILNVPKSSIGKKNN